MGYTPNDQIAGSQTSAESHRERVKILKGERELDECRRLLDASRRFRQDRGYDDTWRRMVQLYVGKHWDRMEGEDRATVNNIFSTVNVIFPAISANHPKITVSPRRPEDIQGALAAEAVVNYWWRFHDFQSHVRRAIKDNLIVGFGWLKVYWRYEWEPHDRPADPKTIEQIAGLNPEAMNGGFGFDVIHDRPHVDRISPHDVFVDPDATSMQDAKWIAHRFHRPLAAVKEDDGYDAKARKDLGASDITSDSITQPDDRERSPEAMAVLWEFWDVEHGTMCVFADDGEFFLRKPQPTPYPFGHPFVMIRNYEVPDHFYPMGEVEQLEALNMELNLARTQRMNHRKRFARKYMYREGLEDDALEALTSDLDGELVRIAGSEPFSELVASVDLPGLPPEFYRDTDEIRADMDLVSGVTEYQRGGGGDIRRSATEASIIADSSNSRVADKLAVVEKAEAQVGRMVVQLAQVFLTGTHVARIYFPHGNVDDPEGAMQGWEEFTNETIQGEFDFEVEAGSTQPKNEQQRKQQAVEMLNTLAPFVERGLVNPYKLIEHVLVNGWGVRDPAEWMTTPQPQQQQIGQGGALNLPGQPEQNRPPQDEIPGQEPVPTDPGPDAPAPGIDQGAWGDGQVKGVPPEIIRQLQGQVPQFRG